MYTLVMAEILDLLMRWLHISSVVTLIGGMIYARAVLVPSARRLDPETDRVFEESAAAAFRPLVYAAMAGIVTSGLYNLFTHPGHTPRYHMLLGIKLLLVLHVFATGILVVQPGRGKRARLLAGTAVSGLAIILISAYLRRIF
jgi:uncharacterized membrane protein